MSARRHNEHAALVEGRGFEAFTTVPTVAFVYPDDGEIDGQLDRCFKKCQRSLASISNRVSRNFSCRSFI
jgi:hypothetical protein